MRILLLLIGISCISCSVTPAKINFGEDICHYCSMTIVDEQHAAELVTKKGKVYKYDATECMVQSLSDFETKDIALYLVTDFNQPGTLIDAIDATYVISENITSPMRANMAAVSSEIEAKKLIEVHTGKDFDWEEIRTELRKAQ